MKIVPNPGIAEATRTTCPYCGVGCGVQATPDGNGGARIAGDSEHPANFGRLCSKGSALGETLGMEGRLLAPEIDSRATGWDEALDHIAYRFTDLIEKHGPDSIGFYVSGQLLTEDYYVANKLLKGFIGSRHLDTNSRLCMASSVAGHRRAFGADTVPGTYEDLEQADLVVLTGSNLAWCHPVLFQRIVAAREKRPALKVVVIDPRRTATCDIADLHLPLAAGSDVALFNGLLLALDTAGATARNWTAAHTTGLDAALAAARAATPDISAVARLTTLPVDALQRFYDLVARTERVVTVYSQGVNQSSAGTDKVNAIINTHLLTGRIGRPGMGPFSVTGQPNAMGGREVGALANQLAAHMVYDDPAAIDRVRRFWKAPRIATAAGHKAVEFFRAVEASEIKAVWVMATNPAVSLPDAAQVVRALKAAELVVVSDFVRDTDTARHAHVRLPVMGWGEKSGTVTNSERRISRQRSFLPAPGLSKPDWWVVSEVGKRMGFADAFSYDGPAAIFREHAALSALENDGTRDFDIGAMASITDAAYDDMAPFHWPWRAGAAEPTRRFFAEGGFYTPDRRARIVPLTPRPPRNALDAAYPLSLNTGRYRDQWHTMTRTGRAPRLANHLPEPMLALNPDDARSLGVRDGTLARIESRWGSATLRVRISADQKAGACFAPIHWTAVLSATARINEAVNPETDPVSGQPELKATPVRVSHVNVGWEGFLLSRQPLDLAGIDYWIAVRGADHWRYEVAGSEQPSRAWARVRELGVATATSAQWLQYRDAGIGRFRAAAIASGRVEFAAFVARDGTGLPTREWLSAVCAQRTISVEERRSLLGGRTPGEAVDQGPLVCSCHAVGCSVIEAAIAEGCATPAAIGARTKAGTNCGSCLPELRALLVATVLRLAAE